MTNRAALLKTVAYLIVLAGLAVSFYVALVPHYDAGYYLAFSVLLAGILPYLVYGVMPEYVKGGTLLLSGAVLLVVDVLVRVPMRWSVGPEGYGDWIYWVSIGLAAALSVVAIGVSFARRHGAESPEHSATP